MINYTINKLPTKKRPIINNGEIPGPNEELVVNKDISQKVDDKQLAILKAPLNDICVFAVAGSGKTTTLTYRIATMIDNNVPENQIMLLTFTKKAANEMTNRIKKVLNKDELDLTSGTFHSIANILMRQYGNLIGINPDFKIIDIHDASMLYKLAYQTIEEKYKDNNDIYSEIFQFINEFKNGHSQHISYKLLKNILDYKRTFMINTKKAYNKYKKSTLLKQFTYRYFIENDNNIDYEKEFIKLLDDIEKEYVYQKDLENSYDFDDLIDKFIQLLLHPKTSNLIKNRFKYIFVDEYQDINEPQHLLLSLLKGDNNKLFAIGDQNQCIYQFRGSKDKYITQFTKDYPNSLKFNLTYNYRSREDILKISENQVNQQQGIKIGDFETVKLNAKNTEKSKITFLDAETMSQTQHNIPKMLEEEIANQTYSDAVILVRTNMMAKPIEKILMNLDIPYKLSAGVGFYETRFISLIMKSYMGIKYISKLYLQYAKDLFHGIGTIAIDNIYNAISIGSYEKGRNSVIYKKKIANSVKLKNTYNQMEKISKYDTETALREIGNIAIELVLKEENKRKTFDFKKQDDINQDRQKELEEDLEYLIEKACEHRSFNSFFSSVMLNNIKDDSYENKVEIMTMHRAKGLEWNTVILYGVSDELIPSKMDQMSNKKLDDARKLLYVAMTRAKKNLHIINQQHVFDKYYQPSYFLKTILDNPEFKDSIKQLK